MTEIREFAPAKLNLYLHVTGRRADGYHNLDSLVAFASIGDEIILSPGKEFDFSISGPRAVGLRSADPHENLVVKAARSLAELTSNKLDMHLALIKNLPIASGIGGGSSDAAAALRALARYWEVDANDPRLTQAASLHGQDVPACLTIANSYLTPDGVVLAQSLPKLDVVLVNPNRGLSTPLVYGEYRRSKDPFTKSAQLEGKPLAAIEFVEQLKSRHNDLFPSAVRLMPEIATMIAALEETTDCLMARMSGSGATCFGVYKDNVAAQAAAQSLRQSFPAWWVEEGSVNG